MSIKKRDDFLISKNDKNLFSKAFSPMEVSFGVFVRSRLDANDFETANNAFFKYGQFICPELDSDACIFVAKSRYEYLIGNKTENDWFSDLKKSVCDVEGRKISISRQLIDIDFLLSKKNRTNDENVMVGRLFYDILAEEKSVDRVVFLPSNDLGKRVYSILYALRAIEGADSLLNPIDFRDFTRGVFRNLNGDNVSFDDFKCAVNNEFKNTFKLISKGGVVESQFVIAEKSKCDKESAKTKCDLLKNHSDRCLFLSSIAVSLGTEDPDIKNMYVCANEINGRIKNVLEGVKVRNSVGVDAGI